MDLLFCTLLNVPADSETAKASIAKPIAIKTISIICIISQKNECKNKKKKGIMVLIKNN